MGYPLRPRSRIPYAFIFSGYLFYPRLWASFILALVTFLRYSIDSRYARIESLRSPSYGLLCPVIGGKCCWPPRRNTPTVTFMLNSCVCVCGGKGVRVCNNLTYIWKSSSFRPEQQLNLNSADWKVRHGLLTPVVTAKSKEEIRYGHRTVKRRKSQTKSVTQL